MDRHDGLPTGPTVAVLGAGRAGAPLAAALAAAGANVVVIDHEVASARERLIRADPAAAAVPVAAGTGVARGATVVVDALPERLDIKRAVLAAVAAVAPDAVLATTALALPVAEVAAGTAYAGRACAVRWLGPLGGAVELAGEPGSEAVERVRPLLTGSGLGTISCSSADVPGVAAGLLMELLNRSAAMLDAGFATRADLDLAMRTGCGWSRGPLELLEEIGLPTVVDVLDALHARTGRPGHAAAPLLRRLATAHGDRAGFPAGPAGDSGAGAADAPAIERVGVAGTGTMAIGIAGALVAAGLPTTIVGRSSKRASAARAAAVTLANDAGQPASEWLLTATSDVADLADCTLVVEAVVEDLDIKRKILRELDTACGGHTVLATTTSSLAVLDCATATARPTDVVGMHFFNPVASMPLVEIVASECTGPRALAVAERVAALTGRQVVRCADRAGFLVNRLLFPLLNDAVAAVSAGAATAAELDIVLRRAYGLPVGPFRLLDLVGADVALALQENLHREYGDPALAPAPAMHALLADGVLGRKAGRSVAAAIAAAA